MFRNLIKNKVKIKNFFVDSILFLSKNMIITFVPQINFLHKLLSHVQYKKTYQHKRFLQFNIKTLIRIAYPNFKSG